MPAEAAEKEWESHPFWKAVCGRDVGQVKAQLASDPSLAARKLDPEDKWHMDSYPLVQACKDGNRELVELLLNHGADVNADTHQDEPREFGRPIQEAVEGGHYELSEHLLDCGARVDAYRWCDQTMVERLYTAAREAGAPVEMVRRGYEGYLGGAQERPVHSEDEPEAVRLFARVLSMGGQPSLGALVRDEYYQLIEELLRHCPEAPGTPTDWPHDTVFANLCDAASWHGYPRVMEMAMEICPQLHGKKEAVKAIHRAAVSHNRDGTAQDYRELIERQLEFLKGRGELEDVIRNGELLPHFELAGHYCWPEDYGFRAGLSTPESLQELAGVFSEYGFDPNRREPETNRSPLAMAVMRGDHLGLPEYAEWLLKNGADPCRDDPPETNPLEIAKQRELEGLVAVLER